MVSTMFDSFVAQRDSRSEREAQVIGERLSLPVAPDMMAIAAGYLYDVDLTGIRVFVVLSGQSPTSCTVPGCAGLATTVPAP